MLSQYPQQYPNLPPNYPPQLFPSFVSLDFKLKSITNKNDPTVHHLIIATQQSTYLFPHWVTGSWGGGTDWHQLNGFITDDLKFICSWSSKLNQPANHFINDGTLTWYMFGGWTLHGTVTNAMGQKIGPGEVSGSAG